MELQTIALHKRYGGKAALKSLDLTLHKGIYGLLGPNGAGKTTLMRLLCGIQRPSGGKITCDGTDIDSLGEDYGRRLGYLPQQFYAYPDFTALDFLRYFAALKGLEGRTARTRPVELLEAVGLGRERGRKVKTFSGGMKQRLGIAQAMLNAPDLLILDEPTAGLDPKERVRFRNLIRAFGQERIVLLSTHIVSDLELAAENLILLRAGELLHFGSPQSAAAKLEGRVWECAVSPAQGPRLAAGHAGSLRSTGQGRTVLRLVTDHPPAGAVPVPPDLEDLYLYCFQEGGGPA